MQIATKPKTAMRQCIATLLALGCAMLASACDAEHPCGKGQRFEGGICVQESSAPVDADASASSDAASDMDAGAEDASPADVCSADVTTSIGTECSEDTDCDCAAPYCAKMAMAKVGFCTISDCSTSSDNCPGGYYCFDLSAFGVKGVKPFCARKAK